MKKVNIIVAVLVILGIWVSVFGQDKGNERAADQTLRGSGRVNGSTLGMEFSLPLGAYPGRGINVPINLSYSSKLWRMDYLYNSPVPGGNSSPCYKHYTPKFSENSAAGWTTSLAVPYIEYLGAKNFYNSDGTPYSYDDATCPDSQTPPTSYPFYYVRRIVVHLPSGETHELRPDDSVLNFPVGSNCITNPNGCDPNDPTNPYIWNATYYATDGSNIKYIQNLSNNTYRLLMPDGSFYDFDANASILSDRKATTFTDRNGNYTTYNNSNGTWTDTLGRTLSAPIGQTAPAVGIYTYSMPGMSGNYKFNWKQLKGSSAAESGLTNFSDDLRYYGDRYVCTVNSIVTYCNHSSGTYLFSGGSDERIVSNTLFNPTVLAEIELPTGQKYKFSYDVYGRIEKIIYPTGGEEKFQYSQIPTLSMLDPTDYVGGQANFGVTNRKVYKSSTDSAPYEWTYSAGYVTQQEGYKVTINNPDGTTVERYLHRGYDRFGGSGKFGYDNGLAGMAYEERGYDSSNPQKLMSKKLTTWTKTTLATSLQNEPAHWHPRVTSEESIIYDNNGNGISTTTTLEYEDESNLNLRETPVLTKKSSQYAFVVVGDPLPSAPIRLSETTFLINDPNLPQTTRDIYKAQNMVGLATASVVKDAAGNIVSRSEMVYDESGFSPNVGRGLPTTLRVWDSTKGSWDNPNAYLQTRARFDTYGNQYEAIDAKGNATTTTFDATYHAFPIQVTSAVPDPSGTHGANTAFVTTATFDPITGLPLTTTDANGLETRIEYDEDTLRPLNVKTYYSNSQVGTTSETVYHDEPNNYWVKNRTQIDAQNWAETITYFDGLGRAYKAEEVNSQGNIFVEKEFDAEGRVKRVTNPFRAGETKQWTTNVYDEASRIKEVVLPDGAKVKTDYGVSTASGFIGAIVTVTDQADKQRRSITNALGQLIRVDEPDANGSLGTISSPNQPTFYNYNTIGKMTKVSQGVQNRYFLYDSLGRLLRVRQPEQNVNSSLNTTSNPDNNSWTAAFSYDDNGNILTATDAKGVSMSYVYDNLNRIKTRSYSDSTPTVTYKYDNLSHAKGALIEVSSSVSTSKTNAFNDLGQPLVFQQITDGNTYQTTYQYNLFGTLTGESYPSGREVNYDFNTDGDLSRVWGVNGNGCTSNCVKTYANAFTYNSAGAVEKLRLGNGKWETAKYNNRLQIIELGVGNGSTDASLWKTSYEYGELNTNGTVDTTKNSGNVAKQTLSFAGLANPIIQTYKYDSLDRLEEAEEKSNNQQTWIQQFGYDRYGNRTSFNQLIGSQQTNTTPTVDANTNRFQTGQGYVYDLNGNLIQDAEGRQFTFNGDNKQTDVKDAQNNLVGQYLYDGEGKRIKKITNTEITVFVYNGSGQLIAEYSTQTNSNPTTSYLTNDNLGSPRVITDALGQVISRRDFMPFGEEIYANIGGRSESQKYTQNGVDNIRKRFTGYEKDTETGLDFAEARYYHNEHGRFTAVDPLLASGKSANPQTFNRYAYTMNNPVNLIDPSGMISESTGACGSRCQGSGPYVDGSAFRGRDASFDWMHEFYGDVAGYALDQPDGSMVVNGIVIPASVVRQFSSNNKVSVNFNLSYRYYKVSGADPASAMRNGDASKADAVCKEGSQCSQQCDSGFQGCVLVRMTNSLGGLKSTIFINVTVTVFLPQWTGYNSAAPEQKTDWDKRLGELKEHEDLHVEIARAAAELTATELRKAPRNYKKANEIVKNGYKRFVQFNDFFDWITDHGRRF